MMRAVIIATGHCPELVSLHERCPVPLLPLIDRPFIQHVIEFVAGQGVSRFDFILSHFPEQLESFLGDGKRWGSQFTFHLARDPSRPYRLLKTMDFASDGGEPVLLAHGDRLPPVQLQPAALASATLPTLFGWRARPAADAADVWQWTGWALLSPAHLATLPGDADEPALETYLAGADAGPACREVTQPLSVRSFAAILASHRAILGKQFSGLLLRGRETDPGVWLSRNVVLHPTVQIKPPVYLGENSRIGAGGHIGPDAVVGKDCVLDARCLVTNSVLFPGSFVGEGLELADVIVDKNRLINTQFGGVVTITDNFILANLADRPLLRGMRRLLSQTMGIICLILAAPILLVTALWLKIVRGRVLHRKEVVRLPAPAEERAWRTFGLWSFSGDQPGPPGDGPRAPRFSDLLLRFLPALVNIARGDLAFVGVPPRTKKEIHVLPHDWQSLYLGSKAGIVTEASVRYGANPTDDELYAAEGFYTATAGWAHDVKLLSRFLGAALFGLRSPSAKVRQQTLGTTDDTDDTEGTDEAI
jgi:NDP-sugar pyrophosphorylase family protein